MKSIVSFAISMSLLVFFYPANIFAAKVGGTLKSEIPGWFKESFLDLSDDVAEARQNNRRLMIYFHQDGCPYCAELVNNNFSQKSTVDYMKKHFDAIHINMWGDREIVHVDGKSYTEKDLAAALKVWFTPTLLFFNENGKVILRINGYYPPQKFVTVLEYVAQKNETKESFRSYSARVSKPPVRGKLHAAPYFEKPPHNLARLGKNKPVVVFFEQKDCPACDAMHNDILNDGPTSDQLEKFTAVQMDMWSKDKITLFDGSTSTMGDWANKLGISYAPSAVLFDNGKEVIRIEAFLKGFHVQSILEYASSGAYKTETSLQRFIQKRAERIIEQGHEVDLWK